MQGLAPMRGGQIVQMRMDDIFIPLHVEQEVKTNERLFIGSDEDIGIPHYSSEGKAIGISIEKSFLDSTRSHELGHRELRLRTETVTRRAEILELLRERRAIVLGDPGAGKTTMLRYVAYQLANSNLNGERNEANPTIPQELADGLPVYVRIGLYAQHSRDHHDATIADFAPHQDYQLPLTAELLQDAIERGKAVFLLDGLDEIIDATQRRDVARRVEDFARAHSDCPVIVTSRIVGYRESPLGSEFEQFTVRPFEKEEIESFVRRWHEAIGQPEDAGALIAAIEEREPIRRLASNPLLLPTTTRSNLW